MNASLLAALNDAERWLVADTDRDNLKYVGQYRRGAAARVADRGGRGRRPGRPRPFS
jgi:hypothetical protein